MKIQTKISNIIRSMVAFAFGLICCTAIAADTLQSLNSQMQQLQAERVAHNSHKPDPKNAAAVNAWNQEGRNLEAKIADLNARIAAYNASHSGKK